MKEPNYAQWMPMTETSFYVLISLLEPLHGYAVMQKVEAMTEGRIVFGPGSLYGAINNLSALGLIEPFGEADTSLRKKRYRATETGKALVLLEIKRLEELLGNAKQALRSATKEEGGESK